jgi:hypothetical protein
MVSPQWKNSPHFTGLHQRCKCTSLQVLSPGTTPGYHTGSDLTCPVGDGRGSGDSLIWQSLHELRPTVLFSSANVLIVWQHMAAASPPERDAMIAANSTRMLIPLMKTRF